MLTTIGRDIIIENNSKLTTISAFEALESGGIGIFENAKLTTISNFDALMHPEFISILDNDVLATLPSFSAVTTIGESIYY